MICRFPVPALAELPDDIRRRIEAVQEKSGFVPNVFLALARRPDEFRAFFAYHDALMEKDGGLTKAEREMIVVATSNANQCQYCVVAHGAILRIRAKNPLIVVGIAAALTMVVVPESRHRAPGRINWLGAAFLSAWLVALLALVAIGGYGRAELNPCSDIDFMFLHDGRLVASNKPLPQLARIIDGMLYPLWDIGLKVGHSVRSVDECVAVANEDMQSKTSIIEARLITGDEALLDRKSVV